MDKKVCIATNFNSADPAYSLNRVVQDQIKMLILGGFKPIVIVSEHFQPVEAYEQAEIRKIPAVDVSNSISKDATFDDDVDKLYKAFMEQLHDIDVVITHDFIYQPAALKHNIAVRQVAEKMPNIKWLHWIHSATPPYTLASLRPIFKDEFVKVVSKPFPNSYYIAFNQIAMESIANNFGVQDDVVKYVPHPVDIPAYYGFDEITTRLFYEKKLWQAEAVCVYPIRLDRGKQVQYVIKTMAQMKHFGLEARCIIVDFHSTGGDKVTYRDELKNMGIDEGLTPKQLIFTSEFDKEWNLRVPWEATTKLLQYANIYMHPSVSETYSLTTQEAGIGGAVVVLNQDFPPFRDIYGPNAIYRKYSSNWDVMAGLKEAYNERTHTETKYGPAESPDFSRADFERAYHTETAGKIAYHLKNDPSLALQIHLRKNRNLEAVFQNHLRPLLYE